MRILLVEDDATLREVLLRSLRELGHRVDEASDLEQAAYLWRVQAFDFVVLDLHLPHSQRPHSGLGTGLTVLREARARGDETPVLVLTAANGTADRVQGLNAGADDYLGKPFDFGELEARMRAILRRRQGASDQVQLGPLRLDRPQRRFTLERAPLDLPAREFEVLWELMTPCGRVVSKRELSAKMSELGESLTANALEVFILRLRRRLEPAGLRIRTLRGIGYVLEEAA